MTNDPDSGRRLGLMGTNERFRCCFVPVFLCLFLSVSVTAPAEVPFADPEPIGSDVAGVTSVNIGDLNGDGLKDIAVFEGGKHARTPTFAWFQAPDWKRREFASDFQPGPFIGDSALADINGDGRLDVVLPEDQHHGGGDAHLYWFENPESSDAHWSRHDVATFKEAVHVGDVETADMDGDGRMDIVARHLGNNAVRICFQEEPDRWTVRRMSVRPREGLKLADLDRDGRTDIVLNGFWWAAPADPRTGSYTEFVIDKRFFSQPTKGLNNSTKNGIGDIDGDGRADVVFATAEGARGALAWYRCPDDPRKESWDAHVIEELTGCHQAELADFDGDGDTDIAGGFAFGQKGVFLQLNRDRGTGWEKQVITRTNGLYSGVVDDIDGDGDPDIVGPSAYADHHKPVLYRNLREE